VVAAGGKEPKVLYLVISLTCFHASPLRTLPIVARLTPNRSVLSDVMFFGPVTLPGEWFTPHESLWKGTLMTVMAVILHCPHVL
jgi:hypothetical protein